MVVVKKNRFHLIFLFIIFLYYLLPKIFFGGFLFHTTTDFLDSEILLEDDKTWPLPDKTGRQELEIIIGTEHINFTVRIMIYQFIH